MTGSSFGLFGGVFLFSISELRRLEFLLVVRNIKGCGSSGAGAPSLELGPEPEVDLFPVPQGPEVNLFLLLCVQGLFKGVPEPEPEGDLFLIPQGILLGRRGDHPAAGRRGGHIV